MSILLGILKERGKLASELELRTLSLATERYATGASAFYVDGRLGMGLQPYLSHERGGMESAVRADGFGNIVSLDGRLDNHSELAGLLRLDDSAMPDSEIILTAFRHWGAKCFSRFTGDWAIALWSESSESLYLARDHAGTRTLYFRTDSDAVRWATYLDTFIPNTEIPKLSDAYVAAYLTGIHIRDLTPYENVYAIPPAHYIRWKNGTLTSCAHWSPLEIDELACATDEEYEERFLDLFEQSVERRSGDGARVLAELSGGMDSTGIVCLSDRLRRSKNSGAALLDTVSYFDDGENSLDEKKYFSITESARGKVGTHLEMAYSERTFEPHDPSGGRYFWPGADSLSIQREECFCRAVWSRGYRSILSGIGGDELLGGVPDPNPELAGYLTRGHIWTFLKQSMAWSLVDRYPLLESVARTARYTYRLYRDSGSSISLPSWLPLSLRESAREHLGTSSRHPRLGYSPRQLNNQRTWWAVMETLPHLFPRILARPEYRYPYLDKDLVNFLMAIPREQLLRPGRRRALMRRALRDIVPHEILERRRKAFQIRAPLQALRESLSKIEKLFERSVLAAIGYVDRGSFRMALGKACDGDPRYWQSVIRTIAMELWLQSEKSATKSRDNSQGKGLAA